MIGVLGSLAEYERELIKSAPPSTGVVTCQRHQVRAPRKVDDSEHITTAKRMKADGQPEGHRQVPRGEPCDAVPVPDQQLNRWFFTTSPTTTSARWLITANRSPRSRRDTPPVAHVRDP